MPLLFSILEHYNLLSKQPNYTCGLFFFWLDVYVCVLSQSNHEHFQKGLDFSSEALLIYIIFPKINRKPNNSKTERRKGHTGPPDNLEGNSWLADSFLVPAAPEGTYWGPGTAPCEEELPCRFLSHPVTLSRFGGTPEAPDTNLDSILKRDVTLPRKVHLVKAMVFPVVTYGCSTIKKAEHRRIDAFELWYWRRLLRVPWTARRSNQSILREISTEYSSKGLMLKLKLKLKATWCEEPTHWKRPWGCRRLKAGGEGDDRGWDGWMVSSTQWTWVWASLGDSEGQGSLACCSPWGCKESDTTERLNWTQLMQTKCYSQTV